LDSIIGRWYYTLLDKNDVVSTAKIKISNRISDAEEGTISNYSLQRWNIFGPGLTFSSFEGGMSLDIPLFYVMLLLGDL